MFRIARVLTFTGILLFSIANAHAVPTFGAQVQGDDLETGASDEAGGVGFALAGVDNLPQYRAEAGVGGAAYTPLLRAEASNPNSSGPDDRTSSSAEAYQRFRNTSGAQLDVELNISLDTSFTSTGPAADSFTLADVWVYGGSEFDVIESPICASGGLGHAMMLGDAYLCGKRFGRVNMFLETDPSLASSSDSIVKTLMFSVAPDEYFGIHGILRADAIDGSADAFNTLSMEFDDISAANLEASGIPETSETSETLMLIDIEPRSDRNSINPRRRGVIRVAVLGSIDFDALQVDVSTISFGQDGASPAHHSHVRDINHDGFMDMLFRFKTRQTGIVCGDTEATLTGELYDGTEVAGTDTVNTVGCKRKGKRRGRGRRHSAK